MIYLLLVISIVAWIGSALCIPEPEFIEVVKERDTRGGK